jgi:glutathione S-transferase
MIELYGSGPSRWAKCYWMLKELNLEFKEHRVSVVADDMKKKPEYLTLSPFGMIPFIKDESLILFESMAIMNYLGEKHPETGLTPASGTIERALYDQWNSFCVSDFEQPLWRLTRHTFRLPEAQRIPQDVALAKEDFSTLAKVVDQQIGSKRFVVGDHFTAADITMTYTLDWAKNLDLIDAYPNCQRYMHDHMARPAFPEHLFGFAARARLLADRQRSPR